MRRSLTTSICLCLTARSRRDWPLCLCRMDRTEFRSRACPTVNTSSRLPPTSSTGIPSRPMYPTAAPFSGRIPNPRTSLDDFIAPSRREDRPDAVATARPPASLSMKRLWVQFLLALLLAGCAHYPVNARLTHAAPETGYRFTNLSHTNNSDSLFVVLAFSGGGTRAAALSYGVLEELAKTQIVWEGKRGRLLDEVDR